MDAIELRVGEMRRYIITMIDEHSDYALALAARLFPVGISQIITDNGNEFLGSFDKTLQQKTPQGVRTNAPRGIYFKREQKLQYVVAPYMLTF